jgi:hypothetical protein
MVETHVCDGRFVAPLRATSKRRSEAPDWTSGLLAGHLLEVRLSRVPSDAWAGAIHSSIFTGTSGSYASPSLVAIYSCAGLWGRSRAAPILRTRQIFPAA